MRPNTAETAVHGCLILARVLCKYVRKDQTNKKNKYEILVEDLISGNFLYAKEKKQG